MMHLGPIQYAAYSMKLRHTAQCLTCINIETIIVPRKKHWPIMIKCKKHSMLFTIIDEKDIEYNICKHWTWRISQATNNIFTGAINEH